MKINSCRRSLIQSQNEIQSFHKRLLSCYSVKVEEEKELKVLKCRIIPSKRGKYYLSILTFENWVEFHYLCLFDSTFLLFAYIPVPNQSSDLTTWKAYDSAGLGYCLPQTEQQSLVAKCSLVSRDSRGVLDRDFVYKGKFEKRKSWSNHKPCVSLPRKSLNVSDIPGRSSIFPNLCF